MKALTFAAIGVTLLGIAALGIVVAPSVYGQSAGSHGTKTLVQDGRDGQRSTGRGLAVLAGRGGELGVRIADARTSGVEIEEVEPDSAAAKAGLKAGDVIIAFDGERVRSARQFARLVRETAPGRTIKATISRNDRQQDVEITLAEGRDSAVIIDGERLRGRVMDRFGDLDRLRDLPFNFNFDFPGMTSGARLGVTVTTLTSQLAEYFGAKEGVLVAAVTDGSAAARAGVKAGDVITSVNGTRVASREDLVRVLRDAQGDEVTLGVVRDKKETTMRVNLEPRRPSRSARPA